MGIGLIKTGVVNILFGFSTSLCLVLLWARWNAFFRGFDRLVCALLADRPVLRTERFAAGVCYGTPTAQCRRGADPSVMAAVRPALWLARRNDGGRIACHRGGHGPAGGCATSPRRIEPSPVGDWRHVMRAGGRPTARGRGAKSQRNPR